MAAAALAPVPMLAWQTMIFKTLGAVGDRTLEVPHLAPPAVPLQRQPVGQVLAPDVLVSSGNVESRKEQRAPAVMDDPPSRGSILGTLFGA